MRSNPPSTARHPKPTWIIVGLVTCCLLSGPLVNRGFAVAPPGYVLKWSDEFNGNTLDTSKWYADSGGWNNDEVNSLDPAALSVSGGYLTISTYTGTDGLQHTGYLETYYQQKYGYFKSRIQYRQKNGTDSAFWMISPQEGKGNGAAMDGWKWMSVNIITIRAQRLRKRLSGTPPPSSAASPPVMTWPRSRRILG